MLTTRMISFMKWTKDTMAGPPPDATLDKLVAAAKDLGATHCEVATVLGRPNWAFESKRWADRIHKDGMKVTWRCASDVMEGLYGVTKAVGGNRKPTQYYIDLAVNAITANPGLFANGDEWAIYPERTEGIWQDSTSWLWPNDPTNYAAFFTNLANSCKTAFQSIGKQVQVGLQANNGSELLSGWMSRQLIDYAGFIVVDHYADSDPNKLIVDLRNMKQRYAKPIYLQESAPDRFNKPDATKLNAYFSALQTLTQERTLERYGFWGGWDNNTPESIFNTDLTLNEQGQALKKFFLSQQQQPGTVDLTPVLNKLEDLRLAIDSRVILEKAEAIIWGTGTLTTKVTKLKELIPNT